MREKGKLHVISLRGSKYDLQLIYWYCIAELVCEFFNIFLVLRIAENILNSHSYLLRYRTFCLKINAKFKIADSCADLIFAFINACSYHWQPMLDRQ